MKTTTPTVHSAARRRVARLPEVAVCAALALMIAAPATAQFFPGDPSVVVFDGDFSGGLAGWTPETGVWATRNTPAVGCGLQGAYGDYVYEASGAPIVNPSLLLIDDSRPGNPGYDPADWSNIRIEVDLYADADHSQGLVWHGTPDTNADGQPDDYYMFVITPGTSSADPARWTLIRRDNDVDAVVGSAVILTGQPADEDDTIVDGHCYRIRLEWACGNLRVQVRRQEFFSSSSSWGGCGSGCNATNPDACWCTIVQWTDTVELNPGFAGVAVGGSSGAAPPPVFDNVSVRSWTDSCFLLCDPWSGWTEVNRDTRAMKFLYEGAVLDFDYGRDILQGRIDVATESPSTITARNSTGLGFCNGWKMLVDLPGPTAATDNLDAIRAFLQPAHTAVDYVSNSGFSWQDDFDNDPVSATYNPIPMVADGSTPIANAMYDAYQWYKTQRTTGPWSGDPLADCRFWYVVLITDGEQACGRASDAVCQSGEAADLFANPDVPGLDPVPVFTIGFSEDVTAASPLQCIADYSDQNDFFTAANASDLADTLYEVFNRMDPVDRSFVPFKVSPPPSSAGSTSDQQDFLSVFPFFVPKNTRTIWDGTLYAFVLNETTPTLPATGDCEIDFADPRLKWNANASLAAQFGAGYSDRRVYIGDDASGDWARLSMLDVFDTTTYPTLLTEFQTGLDVSGGVTDLETQEVVNFVRNIRDTTLDAGAQDPPRPVGVSVLGDIYHSQPVIIAPPNDPQYYYDFGYEDTTLSGMAGQYRVFTRKHAQRRRVVLAGANDGMLHAFDAGYYDRDDGGTYDDVHDPGNGNELFAYTPRAVWDRLHFMTYGEEHQYMVDGHTVTGDVFIDHDDDGTAEWRTVSITGMRRGGRGYMALDLTQPDILDLTGFVPSDSSTFGEVTTWTTGTTELPTCEDGTAAGCDADYPYLLWEFADTADADANCPGTAPSCEPYQDLGWTWSRPAIARLAVYNSSDPAQPDSQFVAFFGGGWDRTETDSTGNFIYAVDLEDGTILYKQNIGVSVPGSVRALDSDLDGFHDRVYFGDTDGSVWRIAFPTPTDSSNNGVTSGELLRLFDFRGTLSNQQFYAEPITVPALFNGGDYTWALAIGSGDRANLGDDTAGTTNHFFFLLDDEPNSTTAGGYTPKGASDLDAISFAVLGNINSASYTPGADSCGSSSLDPANGKFGWYLSLRTDEKVNFEASVVNGFVNFPTFEPGDGLSATDPPDACSSTPTTTTATTTTPPTTPTTPTGTTPTTTGTATTAAPVCTAAGIGRIYKLWFECATAKESGYLEVNDIITGSETYTIGGETYVSFTGSTTSLAPTLEYPNAVGNIITNWRQR